jgi:DNA-binding Xre family transcriptional regulator
LITCALKQILDGLPDEAKGSYRGHARAAGVEWQLFLRLLNHRSRAVDLEALRKIRQYLAEQTNAVQPGETRFHLGQLLEERKIIRDKLAAGTGKKNLVTFSRMANNTMQRADFGVMEAICEFLQLDSLEELLDTGGLLVWIKSSD